MFGFLLCELPYLICIVFNSLPSLSLIYRFCQLYPQQHQLDIDCVSLAALRCDVSLLILFVSGRPVLVVVPGTRNIIHRGSPPPVAGAEIFNYTASTITTNSADRSGHPGRRGNVLASFVPAVLCVLLHHTTPSQSCTFIHI